MPSGAAACVRLSPKRSRSAAATAAKIVGETADIRRFRSKDAFARYSGTAPLPVWSSNHPRHRLSRVGNRQLNCAIHRIALTQAHWHADAQAYLQRRKDSGATTKKHPGPPGLSGILCKWRDLTVRG